MTYSVTSSGNVMAGTYNPLNPVYTTNTNTTAVPVITWSQSPYTLNPNSGSDTTNTLHVKGNAEFEGAVKIGGKDLAKTLDKIEEKLAILHPNEELEKRWGQLRDLRKQYMDLEKELLHKEEMWDILKK